MTALIPQPPHLQGTEAAQLIQMHRFLFTLSEQLNNALLETDSRIIETKETAQSAFTAAEKSTQTGSYNDLKALVIKTASDVRSEMDVLESTLKSEYIAKSEWGTYEEQIQATATATAESTIERFGFEARLDALDEQATGFDEFIISSNGYIRRGIIGYDESNMPIFGIAIGEELKTTSVTIDGVEYVEFDKTHNMATYTADKLSFWINGVEMAWMSNSELHIDDAWISDLVVGLVRSDLGEKLNLYSNEAIVGIVETNNETQNDMTILSTRFEQTSERFQLEINSKVGAEDLRHYLRYQAGTAELGASDSRYKLQAASTGVMILQDNEVMTRMEQNTVAAPVFDVGRMLRFDPHEIKVSASGVLLFN